MSLRPRFLPIRALAALLLAVTSTQAADRSARPATDLSVTESGSETLFETAFPVRELVPGGWTPEQQETILPLLERLRADDRILLVVRTTVDPIGSREENERWATDISRAVAARLMQSGVPEDRLRVLPGAEDSGLFDEPRWEGFARRQVLTLRCVRAGERPRRPESLAEPADRPGAREGAR